MINLSPSVRLLAGRSCAVLATALIPLTLTLALVRTGSAADLGLVLACELVPMLLLLPVAGVAADRLPPRRVVFAADLVRAAAQFAIAAELFSGQARIPVLAVLSAVTGAAVAFGTPAVRTLVVAVIAEPERLRVNARLGIAQGLAGVAAPAVAGGLALTAGVGWAFLLTGALFLASAATLGRIAAPLAPPAPRTASGTTAERPRTASGTTAERPATASGTTAEPRMAAELREGWAEIRRHPWFLGNVLAHGVWHLASGLLLTLGPLIAVRDLGGETSWVLITQVGTAGMLLGVYAAGRLPVRRPLVVVAVGAALYALPLLAFALRLPVPVIAFAQFAAMAGLGALSPLWETELQRRVPREKLGRVGSCDTLISFAARPLGLALAVPLAAPAGAGLPLAVAAVLVAAANLAVLLLPGVASADSGRPRGPAGVDPKPESAA
ncbi:MFS transporter [Streptomyces jumonjinensis]|uniref:MFS transporter n=1 Tax=Streptomyces jumonjinensis TaxID=1945 RepID=A0A646KH60_STRJU|nr:MFS transporter [Streptomyces jumonjinensis]MQT01400.1 MFS transporter [Streptomyces jumonjinensis]